MDAIDSEILERQIYIDARPETVFSFFITATTSDLGSNYPETGDIAYELDIWWAPGGNFNCKLTNLNSGNSTEWVVSSDMPAETDGLLFVLGCNSGTTGTGGEAGILLWDLRMWCGDWRKAA